MLQILSLCFTGTYACIKKTWAKTAFLRPHRIVIIFKKQVGLKAFWRRKKNSKIVTITHGYKEILNNLIDSLDLSSLLGLIDEKFGNMLRSRGSLTSL